MVKAYVTVNGEKGYVKASPMVFAYTSGGTKSYTNPRSVKVRKKQVLLKAGKTYKIKARVIKLKKGRKLMPSRYVSKLRYISSDTKIAKVTKTGRIKARSKGACKVYAVAANGVRKAVKVTVK